MMSRIELNFDGSIAYVALTRPDRLNALDQALLSEFEAALASVRQSPATVLVTTGSGRAYCAGSDLSELAPCDAQQAAALEAEHGRVFAQLDDLRQITVAAWHGHVLGGGMFLGTYHDFRVAAEGAHIGLPEVPHGWTPPWGVSRLVELVGWQAARRLLFTGWYLDGSAAQKVGLVDACWSDTEFHEQSRQWLLELSARPPVALAQTKALLRQMRWMDHRHWDQKAVEAFERCYATDEAREAVDRFIQRKRKR